MFVRHSEKRAIIQVKLECRPANPAYSLVAGYTGRWVAFDFDNTRLRRLCEHHQDEIR